MACCCSGGLTTCYCDDGVTLFPPAISATLFLRYIDGFYGVGSDEEAWRGTYSLQLRDCGVYEATIPTPPEPYNRFFFLVGSTINLRMSISGSDTGLFVIAPSLAPGETPIPDYFNARWVVSGSIRSIICSGGSVKRYRLEDGGYRFASVEIIANPLP